MAVVAELPVTAGPTAGTGRSAREVVPDALWDKQVGLFMRDHPTTPSLRPGSWVRITPTC